MTTKGKRIAKSRPYYTLIIRTPNQLWAPEFGDYDRKVVEQEQRDQMDGTLPQGTKFKIIKSLDHQAAISAQVELENVTIKRSDK